MSATKRRSKASVRADIGSDTLIAAIRDRGVMSHDLRYCAHEAHHALVCRVRQPWTVDAINEAMQRTFRRYSERLVDEFRARASPRPRPVRSRRVAKTTTEQIRAALSARGGRYGR